MKSIWPVACSWVVTLHYFISGRHKHIIQALLTGSDLLYPHMTQTTIMNLCFFVVISFTILGTMR